MIKSDNFYVKYARNKMRSLLVIGIRFKKRSLFVCCALTLFIYYLKVKQFNNMVYEIQVTTPTSTIQIYQDLRVKRVTPFDKVHLASKSLKIPSKIEFRMNWIRNKLERIEKHSEKWNILKLINSTPPLVAPNYRVHIFYLISFKNIEIDGLWKNWDNGTSDIILKNRSANETSSFAPPTSIASNFYPVLGCYSSKDAQVIRIHFKQIRDAGIGVVIVPWLSQEPFIDDYFGNIFNEAKNNQLKIVFCIEVLPTSSAKKLLKIIHIITEYYTTHPAFYKVKKNHSYLPVYYFYNSHLIPAVEWRTLLANHGSESVRGTPYDGIFMGLLTEVHHKYEITKSNFDGFYTYFSSNGFCYGSSWKNWKSLEQFAEKKKLLFFPSVSPGYIDTKVRPWNNALTRYRSHGHYYQVAWRSAISAKTLGVSITSFNNWQEGSQIEPAQSKSTSQFTYLDYQPEGPFFYLNLTRYWIKQFMLNSDASDLFLQ